jgi:exoribonuclease R
MVQGILTTRDYKHFKIISSDDETSVLYETPEGRDNEALLAKGCLPGDTVEWTGTRYTLVERSGHGILVGTLELASRTTYGMTSRGSHIFLFIPYNRAYPPFLVGSSEKDRSTHRIALIEFDSWDTKTSQFPRGQLQRLLGPVGDRDAEEEALIWFAHPWPSLRAKRIDAPSHPIPALEADAQRQRITGYTFNIDPSGCRDIDDVITVEKVEGEDNDQWRITVTIADVAAFVDEMGALDILASTFGQTLYKDGEAIRPMLPPSISEGACSLIPGEDRHGVSMSFLWNRSSGEVGHVTWSESIIHNIATFTYDEASQSDMQPLTILREITGGSSDSHKWIEYMMLLYNKEAAKLLRDARVGILRSHSPPDIERLAKYSAWDSGLAQLAMESATYCSADKDGQLAHFGIGADVYCHASSPLRRYADLMNQRILKQLIRGKREGLMVTVPIQDLNARSKAVKQYEKNLLFVRELLSHTDGPRIVSGRILDIAPDRQKCSVWIDLWKKKISIHAHDLGGFEEGEIVQVECAMNLLGRHWKDRLVIRLIKFVNRGCQAERCLSQVAP